MTKTITSPDATGLPSDPSLDTQWYTGTGPWSVNIRKAWMDYTGQGLLIADIDDGFDYTHADLSGNYRFDLDYDFKDADSDARDTLVTDRHGTAVMGLIAADDNGTGTVGIAHDAGFVGYRVSFGSAPVSLFSDALNRAAATVDVVNNSWSFTSPFSDDFNALWSTDIANSLVNLASGGRGGLGTVTVFSGGNGRANGDSANYHNMQNSSYTIAVAATDNSGAYASFSNKGANLLVAAPGVSLYTTDKTGANGYNAADYTSFSGTSGSAPIVSGIAALILEANDTLGYRDVQEILAYSARHNDAGSSGWQVNGAKNWNGGGLYFSHDYGFGLVDATAAVRLAETWTKVQTFANLQHIAQSATPFASIGDMATVSRSITIPSDFEIEHVLIDLGISHGKAGDLVITLTSPSGTQSVLTDRVSNGAFSGGINFEFSSVAHWGENAAGTWTLTVQDMASGNTGVLNTWGLEFVGHAPSVNDTYVFTDELGNFSGGAMAARSQITDLDGGIDAINAASVTSAIVFDLASGGTIAGKALTIAAGAIENFIAGDGNDTITGSAIGNMIWGGRGHDMLNGGGGTDTLWYKGLFSDFSFTFNTPTELVISTVSGIDWGTDTVLNFELFQFDDVVKTFSDLWNQFGPPPPPPPPPPSVFLEAEHMTLSGGYETGNMAAASGGKGVWINGPSGTVAKISTHFTGQNGVYDLTIAYFDENDGIIPYQLRVNGVLVDSWLANQNLGSASANAQTLTSRVIHNLDLSAGDVVELTAAKTVMEGARVDSFHFVATGGGQPVDPPPVTSFSLEAENMTLSGGYVVAGNTASSCGKNVEIKNVGVAGTIETIFSGADGVYDLDIAYFDELDSAPVYELYVNGVLEDLWIANKILGSYYAIAQSLTSHVVQDLDLQTGDVIALRSTRIGNEQNEVDKFTFTRDISALNVSDMLVSANDPLQNAIDDFVQATTSSTHHNTAPHHGADPAAGFGTMHMPPLDENPHV